MRGRGRGRGGLLERVREVRERRVRRVGVYMYIFVGLRLVKRVCVK